MPPVALLVSARWGDEVLAVRRIAGTGTARFGDDPSAIAPVPAEVLGAERLTFAELFSGSAKIHVPAGATAIVRAVDGWVSATLGPASVDLHLGDQASLTLGAFELGAVAIEPGAIAMQAPLWGRVSGGAALHVAAAAMAHALLFVAAGRAAMASEAEGAADQAQALRSLMIAAERHAAAPAPIVGDGSDFGEGRQINASAGDGQAGGGERAALTEGGSGSALSRSETPRRSASVAREGVAPAASKRAPAESFESAMIGLLNAAPSGSSPFGPFATSGDRDVAADGAMWARSIGEAAGSGGLALHGVGLGGGGDAQGIGVGKIGSLGHTDGPPGTGTGGEGSPMFRHTISVRTYRPYRCSYSCQVSGRLPPEAVQRIVRQNFPLMRGCYETGLRRNPALAGRVTTQFVIGRDGSVSNVVNGGSDLPDAKVVSCIGRAFYGLAFPQPEGGVVNVTYPIVFTPTEPGPEAAQRTSASGTRAPIATY